MPSRRVPLPQGLSGCAGNCLAVLLSNLDFAWIQPCSRGDLHRPCRITPDMIRKLKSGQFRLYSRKKNAAGKRRNLGTFSSLEAAKQHEREVQFFKRH